MVQKGEGRWVKLGCFAEFLNRWVCYWGCGMDVNMIFYYGLI